MKIVLTWVKSLRSSSRPPASWRAGQRRGRKETCRRCRRTGARVSFATRSANTRGSEREVKLAHVLGLQCALCLSRPLLWPPASPYQPDKGNVNSNLNSFISRLNFITCIFSTSLTTPDLLCVEDAAAEVEAAIAEVDGFLTVSTWPLWWSSWQHNHWFCSPPSPFFPYSGPLKHLFSRVALFHLSQVWSHDSASMDFSGCRYCQWPPTSLH